MQRIAIIGGTGVYDLSVMTHCVHKDIITPYGHTEYMEGVFEGRDIIFMARHGSDHSIPPHLINYRANIWALKKLGVEAIISTTAVGSLREEIPPGTFVIVDQFIDFTKKRVATFYNGEGRAVVHTDMTVPYCPTLRNAIISTGNQLGASVVETGCYVCTEGPRFETPAEVRMFALWGGDVVGMTNVPEVTLAAEAEMCYATISLVSNYGAGISKNPLTHTEVFDIMKEKQEMLRKLIFETIKILPESSDCSCDKRLEGYGGFTL